MPTKQAGETNLADLSDLELVQYARDEITARAAKIAELTGLRRAAVEHGLYGYRWPTSKCGIDGLCDVLIESRMILDAVESGMTLGAAAGAVAMAVGVKEHGGKPLPKLVPPPVFPG